MPYFDRFTTILMREKMPYHFCTITSSDYLYRTCALYESLMSISSLVRLHVLMPENPNRLLLRKDNIYYYTYAQLESDSIGRAIIKKYKKKTDKMRWSLKSVFLHYLLSTSRADKVIYIDSDIAFFHDFSFLFDLLDAHPVLLTPHRYPRNPFRNQEWLETNFTNGLFNAGFFACNREAMDLLRWWASCCLYRCERNMWRGLFDDQKYLDLVPILEPRTRILEHEGCNVADWNREVCQRIMTDEGLLINGKYPIIFIHFNNTTLRSIQAGEDPLLKPFFDRYTEWLRIYKPDLCWQEVIRPVSWKERWMHKFWRYLNYLNGRPYVADIRQQ